MSVGTSNTNSCLVAHYLCGDHSHGLALCGIDLARHDTAAWLILGETEFTEATARAGAKKPNVIRDLHQGTRDDVQGAMSLNKGIVTS